MDIKNKVIIVTGASSGIGEAAAKVLAGMGAKIVLVARDGKKIQELSAELPDSFAIVADMSKEAEVKAMAETANAHFGGVDILINNAGQGYGSPVEQIDTEKFRYLFDLNVIGPLVAMQAVFPIMKKQGSGLIVNISSGTALMYLPNIAAYSATKRALGGITLTARAEWEKDNIKVCAVYPYITATNFYKNTLSNQVDQPGHIRPAGNMPQADSAEHVAEKILEAIITEQAETFAHDRMK